MRRALVVVLLSIASAAGIAPPAPCAPPHAKDPMPEGSGHDHHDPKRHGFFCGIRQLEYFSLEDLVPEPAVFGEIDVAENIAVMATAFPDAGFVTFDVSSPEHPVALSRFRGPVCEIDTDVDCGADVKLSPDGRTAFLAIQRARPDPNGPHPSRAKPTCAGRASGDLCPGVMVVDLSNPRKPRKASLFEIEPVGVHMLAYHAVRGVPYVFARAAGLGPGGQKQGVLIARVLGSTLKKVGEAIATRPHDVSLYDDPVDHTTYMYVSGGYSGTLSIFDAGDPAHPKQVGEWKPAPEVPGNTWYVHNAYTIRRGARRLTFVGPETFGRFNDIIGHGSVAAPLWLLDTTDNAHPTLVGEWRNPGKHPAGDLILSTHNSTFAEPGLVWLAHYHGGVWLLDWRPVLDGTARRPVEIGYAVPSSAHRTLPKPQTNRPFITDPGFLVRPLFWDVVPHKGVAYASDMTGGMYVFGPQPVAAAKPKSSALRLIAAALAAAGLFLAFRRVGKRADKRAD